MPRLRRLKNYDITFEQSSEDLREEDTSDSRFANINGERSSGESWLSNASIISSFTDEKLRSSARYYREMARLFEEELLGRRDGTRERWTMGSDLHSQNAQSRGRNNGASQSARKINRTVKAIAQAINAGLTLEEIHRLLTQSKD